MSDRIGSYLELCEIDEHYHELVTLIFSASPYTNSRNSSNVGYRFRSVAADFEERKHNTQICWLYLGSINALREHK